MKKDDTYLKIVKFVGRLALICTLLLFTFLVVESCLPGELSGAFTSFITGKVDSSLDFRISWKRDIKRNRSPLWQPLMMAVDIT